LISSKINCPQVLENGAPWRAVFIVFNAKSLKPNLHWEDDSILLIVFTEGRGSRPSFWMCLYALGLFNLRSRHAIKNTSPYLIPEALLDYAFINTFPFWMKVWMMIRCWKKNIYYVKCW
jgi:hypothetical protein